jgi:hypothetical protein
MDQETAVARNLKIAAGEIHGNGRGFGAAGQDEKHGNCEQETSVFHESSSCMALYENDTI